MFFIVIDIVLTPYLRLEFVIKVPYIAILKVNEIQRSCYMEIINNTNSLIQILFYEKRKCHGIKIKPIIPFSTV